MGRSLPSIRQLAQFEGKTEEEINKILWSKELSSQVEKKLAEFAKDYDLSDMKSNDKESLRRMAALMVRLESAEQDLEERLRSDELDPNEALKEEQRLGIMRRDLIALQESLGITRAKRIEKTEENPLLLWEDIKARARHFLQERLAYVRCCQCNIVLAVVNFTYPESNNEITVTCGRCGKVTKLSGQKLLELEKKNPYK